MVLTASITAGCVGMAVVSPVAKRSENYIKGEGCPSSLNPSRIVRYMFSLKKTAISLRYNCTRSTGAESNQ